MAGDWIKMRSDLSDDPAVFKIAGALNLDRFSVIGRLHAFWAWADKHAVDGRVDGASSLHVDDVVRFDGFANALAQVSWLLIGDDFLEVPNHDRHNSQSAKERAQKNARQARWRHGKAGNVDGCPSTDPSTREEKRREEKNRSNTPSTPTGEDGNGAPKKVKQDGHGSGQARQIKHENDLPEGFEAFWERYPRKIARANVLKAWMKLKPNAELVAKIMQSVAYHCVCADWVKDDGQFIPHPATWLNGKRWEDEVRHAGNVRQFPVKRQANEPNFNDRSWADNLGDL